MISFDEATELVAPLVAPLSTETVHLSEAAGRTLAEPVVAHFNAPRVDTSAMDGYAVRESEINGGRQSYRVVGVSYPGKPFDGEAPAGTTVRIFTGADVPPTFDRVVTQESVEGSGEEIILPEHPGQRRHIRKRGSDFCEADVIVPEGNVVTPLMLAAIAATDVSEVQVHRQPNVAILTTGDELAAPGTASRISYAVPDSLSVSLAAMIRASGGTVGDQLRLRDNKAAVAGSEERLIAAHDITVIAGGASVGVRDFAKEMFGALNPEFIFNKVAMKPGKPVWLARAGGRFIVGLPGNPGSALVTARLFLVPLIAALCGRGYSSALNWRKATLIEPLEPNGAREDFQRGRYTANGIMPISNQDSSAQAPLAHSNALIRRPVGDRAHGSCGTVYILDF